jgi:hypothetical protein
MPGCVLRIESTTPKVERLIAVSQLRPIVVYRKGEPRVPQGTSLSPTSGFNVDVSRADGSIERQARDAVRFLKRHSVGLRRLRRSKTFAGMTLDFGLFEDATEDRPWPSYRLPAALIEVAGKHHIELVLSFYGARAGDGGL